MNNQMKIGIGILIVVLLVGAICLALYFHKDQENDSPEENTINEVPNELPKEEKETEKETEEENPIEENKVEENQVKENNVVENNTSKQEPIGKEEQESQEQKQEVNPEEKAIELAKQAWGENSDAYQFVVGNREDHVYMIEVRSVTPSSSMTIAYFSVDVKTGEVKKN